MRIINTLMKIESGLHIQGTRYCLNFAKVNKDNALQDVIYTDETTAQIEAHRQT